DVLLPTQEQVAVLSRASGWMADAGVRTIVPDFDALASVFDKVTARTTLGRLGVPQPLSWVVDASELDAWARFPVFVTLPVATASAGVQRVGPAEGLTGVVARWRDDGRLDGGRPVLLQAPAEGPLAMVQAVFDHGHAVAVHANERVREGAGGGA